MNTVVVGGGIAGLASAHALGRAGVPVTLLEASERLGGKVRTERVDGFVVEDGPDSFVSYRPAALRLVRELGLDDAVIRPLEPRTVFIRTRGRLLRMPEGMGLVLPTRFAPFATSDLFSPAEKARMLLDLALPRTKAEGDVAIGPFLRRRLGSALVDRLAGPLIGGVYGTPIDELSLDAVVPQLRASERRHRSLILASVAESRNRARPASDGGRKPPQPGSGNGQVVRAGGATEGSPAPSPFVSLSGGVQMLVDALADALRSLPSVVVRTGAVVTEVEAAGTGVVVRLADGERIVGEHAVLASPAPTTARLLARSLPEVATRLTTIPHGSTAVVNLAFAADEVPGDVGHGFLVAEDEAMTISACTISSRKWPGRAPDGTVLIRAFIGNRRADANGWDDAALVAAALGDIGDALGLRSAPILTRVSRFRDAMPHYTVGHLERVAAIEAALASVPALRLAGGAYRGVGLPDCIAQGQAAADAVLARASGHDGAPEIGPISPLEARASAPLAS